MWIFTPTSFLSIVSHRDKPKYLLVRARLKGDIHRVFPRAKVTKTPEADYLYRAIVARDVVAQTLASIALNMEYDNVKAAVPLLMGRRSVMMSKVWAAGLDEQELEEYPPSLLGLSIV